MSGKPRALILIGLSSLLAASSAQAAPQSLVLTGRPLTLPGGGFEVRGHLAVDHLSPYDEREGRARTGLDNGLRLGLGLTDSVQLQWPLLVSVGFGDRTAIESPEFMISGGLRRVELTDGYDELRPNAFPSLGFAVRKAEAGGTLRGDIELRGTTPLRVGTHAGELRVAAVYIFELTETLALGSGLGARTALHGGELTIGSTEQTPLLRWSPLPWFDFDAHLHISPWTDQVSVYGGFGIGLQFNVPRRAQSAPATQL